jgi:hypothetical protein
MSSSVNLKSNASISKKSSIALSQPKPQLQKSDLDFAFDFLSKDNKRITKEDITSFYRDVVAPSVSPDCPMFSLEENSNNKKKVRINPSYR